ncbi:MAG: 3-deoxy-8-phosphooctulonate synthase [Planctomycetia bacterium]|nr:3-deoxy-8-phosphooctulonate synthase [Planctomycetia bacterium]
MLNRFVPISNFLCGKGQDLTVFAGPCVIESQDQVMRIAEQLKNQVNGISVNLVFKASYDKANRTSGGAYRGPGKSTQERLENGIRILAEVKKTFGLPIMTDVHEPWQAAPVAEICDVLQIPAFLARQTDLLEAVALAAKNYSGRQEKSRAIHVKKGQFMAPEDMRHVLQKLDDFGAENVLLAERGTFFGYGQLVNDMCALVTMREMGVPVVFDATHSAQKPGGQGNASGGSRWKVPFLARAAVAVGVDALFFETHEDPQHALSDGPNMIPVTEMGDLLRRLVVIHQAE